MMVMHRLRAACLCCLAVHVWQKKATANKVKDRTENSTLLVHCYHYCYSILRSESINRPITNIDPPITNTNPPITKQTSHVPLGHWHSRIRQGLQSRDANDAGCDADNDAGNEGKG
jgi:hypothetical protein